jgi:hypothetical protein
VLGDEAESAPPAGTPPRPKGPVQLDLFAPPAEQLKTALVKLDLGNLTPLKALNWLADWQARLGPGG